MFDTIFNCKRIECVTVSLGSTTIIWLIAISTLNFYKAPENDSDVSIALLIISLSITQLVKDMIDIVKATKASKQVK